MKMNRCKAAVLGLALFAGGALFANAQSDAGQFDLSLVINNAPVVDVFGLPDLSAIDQVLVDVSDSVVYVDGKGKISGFALLSASTDTAESTVVGKVSGSLSSKGTTPQITMTIKGNGSSVGDGTSGKASANLTFKGSLQTVTEITTNGFDVTVTTNCQDILLTNCTDLFCTNYTAATAEDVTNANVILAPATISFTVTNNPGTTNETVDIVLGITNTCDNVRVTVTNSFTNVFVAIGVPNGSDCVTVSNTVFCTNYTAATATDVTNASVILAPATISFTVTNNPGATNETVDIVLGITNTCDNVRVTVTNSFTNVFVATAVGSLIPVFTNVCEVTTNTDPILVTNSSSAMVGTMSGSFKSGIKGDSTVKISGVDAQITDIDATDTIQANLTVVYFKKSFDVLGRLLAASFTEDGLPVTGNGSANSSSKFNMSLKGTAWGNGSSLKLSGTVNPDADITTDGASAIDTIKATGKILGQKIDSTSFSPAD